MSAHTHGSTLSLAIAGTCLLLAVGCRSSHSPPPAGLSTVDAEVNVGYGTLRRSDVSGAVWSFTPDEMDLHRGGAVVELLRSRVPGLEVVRRFDGELSLRLRASRPFQSDEEALVVVDGVPIQRGTLERINPIDVQRIDVLRDAASASIYGSRGSGGVILIMTRRAR